MRRLIRFGISGGAATGVHVCVAWSIFNWVMRDSTVANVAAFVIANLVSYMLNTVWSFSSRPTMGRFVRFASVSGAGFLIAALVPLAFGRQDIWLPTLAVVVCVPVLSYFLHTRWTYRAT